MNHITSEGGGKKGLKIKGFTLAEVLITLVIIGVIAAITVPMLMANYQKQVTVSRLKKAYSTLAQAVNRSVADNGPIVDWTDSTNNAKNLYKVYFKPYLKSTECRKYDECGYEKYGPWVHPDGEWDGRNISYDPKTRAHFYLDDGVFISVHLGGYSGDGSEIKWLYAPLVIIDVNGSNKPNRYGRDVFVATLDNKQNILVPRCKGYNSEYINSHCTKDGAGSAGLCCMDKLMNDNWEIKDGYPW